MSCRPFLILAFLFSVALHANAETPIIVDTSINAHDSVPFDKESVLVWQSPMLAVPVVSFSLGTTPLWLDVAYRENRVIRENVQMMRRNTFDFMPLHFDNYIQFLPFLTLHILDWSGVPSRHSGWSLARRSLGAIAASTAVVQTFKLFIDEQRPDRSSLTSFPSGHTAFSFAGAEMLRLEYGQVSPAIPVAGYAVAALTGFMRIYNDRHWFGDVLSGMALGIVCADLSYWLNDLLDPLFSPNKHR